MLTLMNYVSTTLLIWGVNLMTSEIRHIWLHDLLQEEEIPEDLIDEKLSEWDENTHLGDYPGEVEIDVHYSEEYNELRSMGLTHPQTIKVLNNVH